MRAYYIAFAGLSEGQYEYDFALNDDFLGGFPGTLITKAEVQARVLMERRSTFLRLQLSIEGKVGAVCDLCNEPFDLPISGQDVLTVKLVDVLPPEESFELDVLYLHKTENGLSLAQPLYELLTLSLPMRIAHPDDEQGNPSCNPDTLRFILREQPKEPVQNPFKDALKDLKTD